jgi:hypothetical protein
MERRRKEATNKRKEVENNDEIKEEQKIRSQKE